MKNVIKVLGLVLIPALIGLFFRFGTVHPCGMLKRESRAEMMRDMLARSGSAHPVGKVNGLDLIMGGAIIDNAVDAFNPWQCTRALVMMQTGTPDALPSVSFPAPGQAVRRWSPQDFVSVPGKKPSIRVYRDKQGMLHIERGK